MVYPRVSSTHLRVRSGGWRTAQGRAPVPASLQVVPLAGQWAAFPQSSFEHFLVSETEF